VAALIVTLMLSGSSAAHAVLSGHFASPRWRAGPGTKVSGLLAGVVDALGRRAAKPVVSPLVRVDTRGRVQVRVRLRRLDAQARDELERAGLDIQISNLDLRVVRGWVPATSVWQLASLDNVERITAPDYAFTRAGSIDGQNDRILRCDEVRSTFGVDGTGIRLGVISDGIDHIASSHATGNAPVVTVPADPRCHTGSGDEGSALIEVAYDCAPGVTIGFCGPLDDLEMIECVACLEQAFGADVMVDDLGFGDQPFFADGPVAQAVEKVVDAGVAYFSAAGNSAQQHYQGQYQRCGSGQRHQFSPSDCTMDFRFLGTLTVILQWDEPFGAASSDYDLCVPGLGCSEDVQNGDDDPIEAVVVTCDRFPCPAGIEIYKRSGTDAELDVFFAPGDASAVELLEDKVTTDSIFGHPCVPGAYAVGAIDAAQPLHNAIETYSSRGPCTVKFPVPESRLKPDLTGIDGIDNSGPGGFPSPFFGTSAAAPGVAAVAALLLELNPALTAPQLRTAFETTSVDLGATGPDITYGYGRVDAFEAALAIVPAGFATRTPTPTVTWSPTRTSIPTVTPTRTLPPTPGLCYGDCNDNDVVTVDELITGVAISLGSTPVADCGSFDSDGNGIVTVDELIRAVNAALNGCRD